MENTPNFTKRSQLEKGLDLLYGAALMALPSLILWRFANLVGQGLPLRGSVFFGPAAWVIVTLWLPCLVLFWTPLRVVGPALKFGNPSLRNDLATTLLTPKEITDPKIRSLFLVIFLPATALWLGCWIMVIVIGIMVSDNRETSLPESMLHATIYLLAFPYSAEVSRAVISGLFRLALKREKPILRMLLVAITCAVILPFLHFFLMRLHTHLIIWQASGGTPGQATAGFIGICLFMVLTIAASVWISRRLDRSIARNYFP